MSPKPLWAYKHKYNASRSVCNLGHHHPSKLEGGYCNQLQMLKKNGDIKEFEYSKKFELRVNGQLICNHFPDFFVTKNDGTQEINETKGCETEIWRFKRRLFEALYDYKYIVIK